MCHRILVARKGHSAAHSDLSGFSLSSYEAGKYSEMLQSLHDIFCAARTDTPAYERFVQHSNIHTHHEEGNPNRYDRFDPETRVTVYRPWRHDLILSHKHNKALLTAHHASLIHLSS